MILLSTLDENRCPFKIIICTHIQRDSEPLLFSVGFGVPTALFLMARKELQAGAGSRLRKAHPQGLALTPPQTKLGSINKKTVVGTWAR